MQVAHQVLAAVYIAQDTTHTLRSPGPPPVLESLATGMHPGNHHLNNALLPMRVAFQGETGAFSEEAVRIMYPHATPLPLPSMETVFGSVSAGTVACGVIPIENSLFGSVHVNYDLLRSHDVRITAELNLRIRHALLALPGTQPGDIRRVLSHPQALGQCQVYLKQHLPDAEPVPAYDTAGAAKLVAQRRQRGTAAIASRRAAQEYGLDILDEGIESHAQNYTRFLAIALSAADTEAPEGDRPYKTSVAFALRSNLPGALFRSLAVFALRDLDLHKIESRPLTGKPGKYLFYLDVAGSRKDPKVQRALGHLEEITAELRVLGSYPEGGIWDDPGS